MPTIYVYLDDKTYAKMQKIAERLNRKVEDLAECAVSEAALRFPLPEDGE